MPTGRILARANAMLVRIKGLLHFDHNVDTGFLIGRVNEVLTPKRTVKVRGNSRGDFSVDSFVEWGWKRKRGKAHISLGEEPNPHVMMVGMSGFGKSTLLASMLDDLKISGIPVILFDAHNEHETLVRELGGIVHDASSEGLNVLELDGLSVAQRISELVGLFKEVYALGSIQCTKLGSCLRYTYRKAGFRSTEDTNGTKIPTFMDLMAEMEVFISNARSASERNTLLHLKSKLQPLVSMSRGGSINLNALMGGITSLSLSGLKDKQMRVVYVHELVKRLYIRMHENSKTGGVRLFIAVDEAEFMLGNGHGNSTAIGNIISEGRKYGVGVVMATHMLGTIDKQIVANASTLIAFYSREPGDVNYISNTLAGGVPERASAIRQRMRKLRRGEALLVSGAHRDVRIVRVGVRKKRVYKNDECDSTRTDPRIALIAKRAIAYDELVTMVGFRPTSEQLNDFDVESGVFNFRGHTRRWVMKRNPSLSLEHEVMVMQISHMLTDKRIANYIQDNSRGPDIVAFENGKRIAIEYETGRKSFMETAAMLRHRSSGYAGCVVYVKHGDVLRYGHAFSSKNIRIECVDCEKCSHARARREMLNIV